MYHKTPKGASICYKSILFPHSFSTARINLLLTHFDNVSETKITNKISYFTLRMFLRWKNTTHSDLQQTAIIQCLVEGERRIEDGRKTLLGSWWFERRAEFL